MRLLLLLDELGIGGLVAHSFQLEALPDLREMVVDVGAELGGSLCGAGALWRGLREALVRGKGVQGLGYRLRLLLLLHLMRVITRSLRHSCCFRLVQLALNKNSSITVEAK